TSRPARQSRATRLGLRRRVASPCLPPSNVARRDRGERYQRAGAASSGDRRHPLVRACQETRWPSRRARRILGAMKEQEAIKGRYARVAGVLDERSRRAVAASEALALGWGGITAVSRATGLSRTAIRLGIAELTGAVPRAAPGRIRRPGGGRRKIVETDPSVRDDLERLVEPVTRGAPESPLRWTCKSVRKLAVALRELGHRVSHQWVAEALRDLGYSLQGN